MKVELLQSKFYNVAMAPRDVAEVPDELAQRWIEKKHAIKALDSAEITVGLALEDRTIKELQPAAQDLKINDAKKMQKSELVEQIRTADALSEKKE